MVKSAPVCFVFLFLSTVSFAQPQIEWAKCFGGVHDDNIVKIIEIPSGYILAGTSYCTDLPGHHGYTTTSDGWVVKISSTGEFPQYISIGGWYDDRIIDCIQTNDGGYAVLGGTYSRDADMKDRTDNLTQEVMFLAKLNPDLSLAWVKTYDTTLFEVGYSLFQLSSNNLIVSGRRHTISSPTNGRIVAFDSTGKKLWLKDIRAMDIKGCSTMDNKIMLAGTAVDSLATHGLYDIFVTQLTADGNTQWQHSYGGSGSETANCISAYRENETNKFLIGGYTDSHDDQVTNRRFQDSNGWGNAWVFCVDNNGGLQWERVLGGSEYEFAASVNATSDRGCIVGISTSSADGDVSGQRTSFSENYYVPWIVKLGPSGNVIWDHVYDVVQATPNVSSGCSALIATKDNGYIFASPVFSNGGDVNGYHGGSSAYADAWVVKIAPPTNGVTSNVNNLISSFKASSSANNILCSYNIEKTTEVTLNLFDILGHCIYQKSFGMQEAGNYSCSIGASALPGGYYQAILHTSGQISTAKVVLIR